MALAQIKRAAAIVNGRRGIIPQDIADAVVAAADEVIGGSHLDQFPIDQYQTGSGTSSNMNMNEVLATIATATLGKPVHPNDHVNASQSSNDVFPTAMHLAVAEALRDDLLPALAHLAASLSGKADEFASVVQSGPTHLMDATPVTLGQEFGAFAAQITPGAEPIDAVLAEHGAETPVDELALVADRHDHRHRRVAAPAAGHRRPVAQAPLGWAGPQHRPQMPHLIHL